MNSPRCTDEWGVRVGSSVFLCADGPAAFREEARLLALREDAQAVVLRGGRWVRVSFASVSRPGPSVPLGPRRLVWWERVGWLARWVAKRRPHSVKSGQFRRHG
jgi:hypothetical protein